MGNETKASRITAASLSRTADGAPAIRIHDTVYVAVGNGPIQIRYAPVTDMAIETITKDDLVGLHGIVDDLDAFIADMNDLDLHFSQQSELGRIWRPSDKKTPWGRSDGYIDYGDGVERHTTPSHGGFWVPKRLNKSIPDSYRRSNGWYEEDCEWAKVAVSLPHLFTDRERRTADRILRDWFPDEYEQVNGIILEEGQSRTKDERILRARHANDWIVISAIRSQEHEGMVECIATVGGKRSSWSSTSNPEERTFLVPVEEYKPGLIGFVIDPDRHREIGEAPRFGM